MDHWKEIERHEDDARQLLDEQEELMLAVEDDDPDFTAWLERMSRLRAQDEQDELNLIDLHLNPPPFEG